MTARMAHSARFCWPLTPHVFGVFLFLAWTDSAAAQNVKAVEEDWELVLTEPDPVAAGPQVTCVVSPLFDANTVYASFELNHHTQPEFQAGGVQLQLWKAEQVLSTADGS